ncbi:MAG: hypothetical protein E3J87_00875 [Candidatus Cloacimonadota bacterium]|nr:MAG: hypothetical protein E3J87_00875 [Candidatus Cloacimonadota bacterium]
MNIIALLVSMLFLMGWKPGKIPIPSVKQEIDKKEATIGDRLQFRVEIFTKADKEVVLPENQPFLGKFVVKNRNIKIVTRKDVKRTILEYELVSYDVGKDTIPAISIIVKDNGESLELKTFPLALEIKSVAPNLTGEEDIKGIKPQLGIKQSFWYYLIGFLAIILIAGVVFFLVRKRRGKLILEKIEKKQPWENAISGLAQLSELKPVTPEEIKQFYIKLSFILREYYEGLFEFPALENTTSEIVSHLKMRREFRQYLVKTQNFLNKSDLVKFAKYIPRPVDNEQEIEMVRDIVEKTKKEEEEKVDV